ncbi:6-phosphogluconolactonase [Candidatus Peribacteria bacterium]|nr:6-phosphogluconolactonase [Candidatus Peribacteria bacterium]
MDLLKTSTPEEFIATSVSYLTDAILEAQQGGKTAVIGLSGGSTPKPVYQKLSEEKTINWKRVQFFLIDERYVPTDHADSNTRMIREALLCHPGADAALLAPDTSLPLPECIADYDKKIAALKPDLVVLGMGQDGHIASLFPPVLPEAFGPASVIHTTTESFAVRDRISVTFPVLENASSRLFLITGVEKIALLEKVQDGNQDASLFPASVLMDERTTWIVG